MDRESEDKVVLNRDDFPSNSIKSRKDVSDVPEVRPKKERVVIGKRVRKPFLKRISGTFDEGGAGNDILTYILHDVIIPAAKSTFADLVEGAIDMALFGGDNPRSPRVRRNKGRSYVSYSDMYDRSSVRGTSRRNRTTDSVSRARHDFTGIILNSRAEAEVVLSEIAATIEEYEVISVADLYDLVGIDAEFTDAKYGWYDLVGMSTKRVRDGWSLELPRPRVID